MPDYKMMYFQLAAKVADAMDILLKAQQEGEAQFNIHRDNMIKSYEELLKMLTALDRTDPEVKEKYRETASMIVENMAKSLKVCRTNLSIDTNQSERG